MEVQVLSRTLPQGPTVAAGPLFDGQPIGDAGGEEAVSDSQLHTANCPLPETDPPGISQDLFLYFLAFATNLPASSSRYLE